MSKGWMIAKDAYPALIAHTPSGWAWSGFRVPGKTAYKFWQGIAKSLTAAWVALCDMAAEVDYRTGTQFLGEWEDALGLPDRCLPTQSGSDSDRRKWIKFRLDKRRWTTAQDWVDLAALYGLDIVVTPGWNVQEPALYAMNYPLRYDLFPKLGRFRVYINISGFNAGGYNYGDPSRGDGYPVPYGVSTEAFSEFQCIIERIKPANVIVIWNHPLEASPYNLCVTENFSYEFSTEFC